MTDSNIKELLLPCMINAAIKAGEAIMSVYNATKSSDSKAADGDIPPINVANQAAQNSIKEELGTTRIPIFSEEGREMLYDERRNWELFWLVDPLDGSVEFVNKTNEFTVNIALVEQGVPVAGVIYVPHLKRLYYAWKSYGAYLCRNVEPCSDPKLSYDEILESQAKLPLTKKRRRVQKITLARAYANAEAREMVEKLSLDYPIEIIEQGSSYKFCMLAEGVADYYIRTSSTSEWDTAAGELILAESGGFTRQLESDEPLQYNKENPTNPWFHCRSAVSEI